MRNLLQKKFFPMILGILVVGGIALASSPLTYAHGYHGGHGGGHGHGGGYCNSECPYYNGR